MTKKIVAIVAAVILVIGISAGTTLLVGKKDVSVATKVEDGLSAYELAVQFGYEGTVQEWLESLEGKSAYQIAVDSGYKGTESDWLASLKATSDNTADIKNAQFNSKGELILTLSDNTSINLGVAVGTNGKDGAAGKNGADGKDGQNGTPGKDGVDGKDGVSISEASINNDGQLILTFTDGKSFNLDKVVGAKGEAGIGIANSKINEQGELVLTYSNGQEANLGKVLGADGKDGQDGAAGKDGNAIVSTVINNSGELVVTYSNGTSDNLGVVVGKDGKDGADGKDGINGSDGKDGVNGTNGKDGVDGEAGVGVSSAQINSYGELVITYTNGQISTLGKVIGADGKDGQDGADGKDGANGTNGQDGKDGEDGISISKSEINSKGELVITYSNNEVENLGVVVGSKGADGKDGVNGADGKDGEDGIGIEDIKIESGNLFITLSNGTTMNLGNIKGADGKDGVNGTNGKDGADGKDGQDGAPGADGIDGKDGISISGAEINAAKELVLTFSDGTDKNLGVVVGTDGADGKDGINGTNGADGKEGRGIKKTEINAIGELVITYTDDTSDNLGVIISDNGGAGTGAIAPRIQINASTNEWEISTDGGETYVSTGVKATGADGKDGADGANGTGVTGANINDEKELVLTFSDGTEKNLGVVVGADGKDGADGEDGEDGINGTNGADGKDGEKGEDGADGKDGVGISGAAIESNNHLVLTLSNGDTIDVGVVVGANGKDGIDGEDGKDGVDGEDGADGVGIKNVTVSEEGILTVTLDNDTIFTLGNIRGKDGIGIAKTEINAEGKLVITYTDNKVVTLDKVVGANGVGIKSAEITEDYMLKLVFTDNGTQEVGPIRGEKGADGVGIKNVSVGSDGYLYVTYSNSDEAQKIAYIKGDKGDAGADGKTPYIKNGTWWIGDSDTGIAATGEDGADGKAGVGVANSYVDENLHLWIVLSDGTKIDAGYVGVTTGGGSTITKYTVVFKDYDGTVLKTEEVESGKSATAPANPSRNGFEFAGWDKDFTNITSSIVVTAKYTENTKPTIQVSNVTAKAGGTVQVPVIIKNNPGIAGATLTLTYNSGLSLTSADSGEAFAALTCSKPGKFTSPCKFTWDSESGETKENGTILYLNFTVPSTASAGDVFEISCSYRDGDIFNDAWDDVTLTTISGGITVD